MIYIGNYRLLIETLRDLTQCFSENHTALNHLPVKPDPVNPAIVSRLAAVRHWRGVTDPEGYPDSGRSPR